MRDMYHIFVSAFVSDRLSIVYRTIQSHKKTDIVVLMTLCSSALNSIQLDSFRPKRDLAVWGRSYSVA